MPKNCDKEKYTKYSTFNKIPKKVITELEEVYFANFNNISDDTLDTCYIKAKSIFDKHKIKVSLGESAIRKNLKARYDTLQEEIALEDVVSQKEERLNYELHKLRRDKLVFNHTKRQFYDNKVLEDLVIERLENSDNQFNLKAPKKSTYKDNKVYNIFLADLHIGKIDLSDHAEIFNKILSKCVEEIPAGAFVKVNIAGDTIDGLILLKQLAQMKADLPTQVVNAYELITKFITQLSEVFTVAELNFVDIDNHGEIRTLGAKRNDLPYNNLSRMVSYMLKLFCDKAYITYNCGEFIENKFYKNNSILFHGHQFKGIKAISNYYSDYKGFIIVGHYHHYSVNDNIITLPTILHSDEYAKSLGIKDLPGSFVIEHNESFKQVQLEGE